MPLTLRSVAPYWSLFWLGGALAGFTAIVARLAAEGAGTSILFVGAALQLSGLALVAACFAAAGLLMRFHFAKVALVGLAAAILGFILAGIGVRQPVVLAIGAVVISGGGGLALAALTGGAISGPPAAFRGRRAAFALLASSLGGGLATPGFGAVANYGGAGYAVGLATFALVFALIGQGAALAEVPRKPAADVAPEPPIVVDTMGRALGIASLLAFVGVGSGLTALAFLALVIPSRGGDAGEAIRANASLLTTVSTALGFAVAAALADVLDRRLTAVAGVLGSLLALGIAALPLPAILQVGGLVLYGALASFTAAALLALATSQLSERAQGPAIAAALGTQRLFSGFLLILATAFFGTFGSGFGGLLLGGFVLITAVPLIGLITWQMPRPAGEHSAGG